MITETKKIQVLSFSNQVFISDRMPIKWSEIFVSTLLLFVFATFFLGIVGLVYATLLSLGYFLFRYSAWVFWKKIEIDLTNKVLSITHMVFNKKKRREIVSTKFDYSCFILKEFHQSGMQRAMLQYKSYKQIDLLLLTNPEDILLVKDQVFSKKF